MGRSRWVKERERFDLSELVSHGDPTLDRQPHYTHACCSEKATQHCEAGYDAQSDLMSGQGNGVSNLKSESLTKAMGGWRRMGDKID